MNNLLRAHKIVEKLSYKMELHRSKYYYDDKSIHLRWISWCYIVKNRIIIKYRWCWNYNPQDSSTFKKLIQNTLSTGVTEEEISDMWGITPAGVKRYAKGMSFPGPGIREKAVERLEPLVEKAKNTH